MKSKAEYAISEYQALRADLLHTRTELQKGFLYTLGTASILISVLGVFFGSNNDVFSSDTLEIGCILIAGIFFLISLNYVSHMRHYVSLSKYLFYLSIEIRKVALGRISESRVIPPVFAWDLWNIKKYNSGLSKAVFFFTWGSQSIFAIVFAIIAFVIAIYADQSFLYSFDKGKNEWFLNYYNIILVSAMAVVALQTVISLTLAIFELFEFIGISVKYGDVKINKK